MVFDISEVTGIGEFVSEKFEDGLLYRVGEKAFLVTHINNGGEIKTLEVRCDGNLARVLQEKYESVMESRYFGRGGVEIVLSGQMEMPEIYDLVRLSYNLTTTSS